MTEIRRNSYDDEDLKQIVERIEAAHQKKQDAVDLASSDCKRTIKVIEAEAKNVGIPIKLLKKSLRIRKLEQKIADEVDGVSAVDIEVFTDMQGQMSFLKPVDEHPGDTPAQVAARRKMAEDAEREAEEQVAGEEALNRLRVVN